MVNYLEKASSIEAYLIELRRWFHQHPELSCREEQTVERICQELDALDVRYVNVPDGGVLAFLGDESRGRTVLLRADIDALPGEESPVNGGGCPKPVISLNKGVAHLCGHDCHAAMLLGAARMLKELEEEIPGRIILMFERGEEAGCNLLWLLKWLFDNNIAVDTSFGMHVMPSLPAGKLGVTPGATMAGSMDFNVKLIGRAAHGSTPSAGNNPIDCFAALYNTIQTLRMRHASPFDPMVFSVGQVHAGTAGNIIPGELFFNGTFRVFNHEDGMHVRDELIKVIEGTAAVYDCRAEYEVNIPSLPVYNDAACTTFARNALQDVFGPEGLPIIPPFMGSESHALTAKLWPGAYLMLGVGNEEAGITAINHNEAFDADENALKYGAAAHVAYALSFLQDGPVTADRIYTGTLRDFYGKYFPTAAVLLD